jgi:hypothetical protein
MITEQAARVLQMQDDVPTADRSQRSGVGGAAQIRSPERPAGQRGKRAEVEYSRGQRDRSDHYESQPAATEQCAGDDQCAARRDPGEPAGAAGHESQEGHDDSPC